MLERAVGHARRLGKATVGALVPARRPSGELMELSLSVAPLEENDGTTGGILAVSKMRPSANRYSSNSTARNASGRWHGSLVGSRMTSTISSR